MKINKIATGAFAFLFACAVSASQLVSPENVPEVGTFWLVKGSAGDDSPPFPGLPPDLANWGLPIYALGDGQYLVDDREVEYGAAEVQSGSAMSMASLDPGDSDSESEEF